MLRGLAILGIFYMNIPFMGARVIPSFGNPAALGWTPADQASWTAIQVLLEGTQRCLLEFLFGAGMMVLTARAMEPDGPVAVADLYYRRNMWLLLFGLFDIFGLLWPGDILHVYAIAALFLFPFRKLGPRALVAIGSLCALVTFIGGTASYVERATLVQRHRTALTHVQAGQRPTAADTKAIADWRKVEARRAGPPELRNAAQLERRSHSGGFMTYATYYWTVWTGFFFPNLVLLTVFEAFCAMCIGIALWKWGVIQGERSTRFYVTMALIAYGVGVPLRWIGAVEISAHTLDAKTIWASEEIARLAMGLGHVALVNWAVRTRLGHAILAPFKAAGRTAFSLYFLEQIIGLWILFAPWGPGLWNRYSWAGLAAIATAVSVVNLIIANLWVRRFANGPLEWLWRSLAYVRWQPFLKPRGGVAAAGPLQGAPLPAE